MDKEFPEQLKPTTIKNNVIRASLFLTAYQILKSEIVDQVKDFYLTGFNEKGMTYSEEYKTEVLSLHKSEFAASCIWLVAHEALTPQDVVEIHKIREMRDKIAHTLSNMLLCKQFEIDTQLLENARKYVAKLGNYWGSIEAANDITLSEKDIDYDGINAVSSIILDYVIQVSTEHVD